MWSALALALTVAACESRSAPTAPSTVPIEPAPMRRVVVLGDSLAVSPSPDESFPSELQARITRRGLPWTVANAGISGDTTSGGVRRLEPLLASDVGLLVIELGANDGLRGVAISAIETNLSTMIENAQRRSIRVLLCGMETLPTHGWEYALNFHNVFPRVASRYAVPLVPFLLAGVALTPDMSSDGIHPNAAGAQRIADTIWPHVEPLLQK
jgi:acyl-CoA thioesterase I